jgi:hypothetical protein
VHIIVIVIIIIIIIIIILIMATKTAYKIPLIKSTMGIAPNKSHQRIKLLNLHPALHTLMQTAIKT